jgi:hypothetical protein
MNTQQSARPPRPIPLPPVPAADATAIRRRLAGLADPVGRLAGTEGEVLDLRETANRFCSILAALFNRDSLDPVTLWERIGTALETACAKVADDDLERWASLCLEHVKADNARVAACGPLLSVLGDFATRPAEWRDAFLAHVRTRRYVVLALARERWLRVKAGEVEL